MKHAFLILAYNNPAHLGRIIRRLASDNHYFFIHIDKKVKDLSPFKKEVLNIKNVYFLNDKQRVVVNWGTFSQIKGELALLRVSSSYLVHFDYYHLMSGADYPVQSNEKFDDFFSTNEGKSFMHFDSPEEIEKWRKMKYPQRLKKWNFMDLGFKSQRLTRYIQIIFNHLFKRSEISNLTAGWQWFSWHHTVVQYVLDYVKQNHDYVKRFRYTTCCDEIFFHNFLYKNLKELNIEKNSYRYIDWHPKRPTSTLPLILTELDYNDIIDSGALICRKVDPEISAKLLYLLDKL